MPRATGGFTTGDVVIGMAVLVLLAGLIVPTLRERSFKRLLERAGVEVETLTASARDTYGATGSWPSAGDPGDIPSEITTSFPSDSNLVRDEYTLQWSTLDVVDRVEAPPIPLAEEATPGDAPPDSATVTFVPVVRTLGSVTVHSGNESLLAELLALYGTRASFVRDTIWTLVVDTTR